MQANNWAPEHSAALREFLAGGMSVSAISRALLRLNRAEHELGADGSALVHDVLVKGITMEQVGQRDLVGQRWKDYFSQRFCECLDRLALVYGFATETKAGASRPVGPQGKF